MFLRGRLEEGGSDESTGGKSSEKKDVLNITSNYINLLRLSFLSASRMRQVGARRQAEAGIQRNNGSTLLITCYPSLFLGPLLFSTLDRRLVLDWLLALGLTLDCRLPFHPSPITHHYLKVCVLGISFSKVHGAIDPKSLYPGEIEIGIEPGAVSLLAIANDTESAVEVVLDRDVWQKDALQCHPLVNTSTLAIARSDIERFFGITEHRWKVLYIPEITR